MSAMEVAPTTVPGVAAPLTLGTAGHIDHGKTTLIGALTGTQTDRLIEERRRGISIELGYALLELPSGRGLSVIDVPGHERFVRTMVAGASGIDLYLMCIAADDGVMPQTREHAAVLRGLGVETGVVAVTKADVLDPALAAAEAADLLPGAPVVAVSARMGTGLDDLRAELDRCAAGLVGRAAGADGQPAVLHVDRSFTIKGAGTVVTGTLWRGTVGRGDTVELLPAAARDRGQRISARVRSVQVHDRPVDRAQPGQRVAVNLTGVGRDEVGRGDVLSGGGTDLAASHVLDVQLDERPPRSRACTSTTAPARPPPASPPWAGASPSCASSVLSPPPAASASCCARSRRPTRLGAPSSSTPAPAGAAPPAPPPPG